MRLEDVLLKPEEIQITSDETRGYAFMMIIPIHPKLVETDGLFFDEELPMQLMPNAAEKWYNAMKEKYDELESGTDK